MLHRSRIFFCAMMFAFARVGVVAFRPTWRVAGARAVSSSKAPGATTEAPSPSPISHGSPIAATASVPWIKVRDVLTSEPSAILGKEVVLQGWVRTLRAQKALAFIEVNDGSSLQGLQAVCEGAMESFSNIEALSTGVRDDCSFRFILPNFSKVSLMELGDVAVLGIGQYPGRGCREPWKGPEVRD